MIEITEFGKDAGAMLIVEYLIIFITGGAGYGAIELMFRGHTHWTMLLTGGACFSLMYLIATKSREKLWKKWIMSASVITAMEFVAGGIVNIILDWEVWDYSHHLFNIMGQVCPLFTLLWFLLSIPAMKLCTVMKEKVFCRKAAGRRP